MPIQSQIVISQSTRHLKMMDSYYNVFSSQSLKLRSQDTTSLSLTNNERASLKRDIAKASQQESSGVKISISNQYKQLSETPVTATIDEQKIFEPLAGVMVKKEPISYLNRYEDMDKRISMVEVTSTGNPPESSSLSKLLQSIEKQDIGLANILDSSGALEINADEIKISGRVEVGNFRGGDFLFDDSGNIIAQKYTNSIRREINETQSIFSITTASGSQVNIELNVEDKMNITGSNGMSRDININYQSSKELTEEESAAVKSILTELEKISTQFQNETSVNSNQVKSLSETLSESSSVIKSFEGTLSFETGGFQRKVLLSSKDENPLSVSTSERGMREKYESSTIRSGFLKSKMGDNATVFEYDKNNSLVSDIREDKANIYIPAISINNQNTNNLNSKYITTFLENK